MRLRAAALRAQAAETARQASEDTGKRSGPSLPAPVSEKSPASGNGNGHANGDGRLGAEPRRMDSNMGLEHLGIWAIRKGGPAGRGRRRFRHVAGVGCLCAHLTSCVCHMATDKDTTKGRGVIRSAREMHKAGLDIRGEIRKSLEVPRGPEGLANLAEVGTEMERGIKGGGSETEGREKAANGTGHGSISGDAVRNPDTRTVSEKAAGKENGSSHRRPLSYDGEKGKVDKREPSPAISSAKLDPILRTGESKARLGRHFTAEPEPLERGNVGSGRSDPRGVASSNLSRVGSSENGVEEAGQSERSSNGIDGGADADGVAQAAANPGGVGDNPKINGVELEKEPVQIGRPSSVELAASSASKSGGVRTEFTSPLSGGSVDADQVEGRFEGEPGLPIRANDPNPGPTADAQSRRLDAGPSSRLLAAPSSDAVVIEVSQLERKPQTRADYDLTPDVKSRSGEPEPPDGEFVGPSDEHRDRTSEEGINEEIGSNHMDDSAYPRELFVPGTIVHVIRVEEGGYWPTPRFGQWRHRAVLVDRSSLRELPIHASMFLDHLPWR